MSVGSRELIQSGLNYLYPPKESEGTNEIARPKNAQDTLTEVGKHAINLIHQEMKMENIPKLISGLSILAANSFIDSLSSPHFWIGTTTLAACGFAHQLKKNTKEAPTPVQFSKNGPKPLALTVTTSAETPSPIHTPPTSQDDLASYFDEIQTSRDAISSLPLYTDAISTEEFGRLPNLSKSDYKKTVSIKCTQALAGIEEYIKASLPFHKLFQTLENKKKMADDLVKSLVTDSSIDETKLAEVTEDFNQSIGESEHLLRLATSIEGGLIFAANHDKLNLKETGRFITNLSVQRELATSEAEGSLLIHQKDLTAINKLLPLYKSIAVLNENVNAKSLESALTELKNLKLSISELSESPRLKDFMTNIIKEVDSHLTKLLTDSVHMEIGNLTGLINYLSNPKRAEALLSFLRTIEDNEIFTPNETLKTDMKALKELASKQKDWQAPHNLERIAKESTVVALVCLGLHLGIGALHHQSK